MEHSTVQDIKLSATLWLFRNGSYFGKIPAGKHLKAIKDAQTQYHQGYYVEGARIGKYPLAIALQDTAVNLIEIARTAPAIVIDYTSRKDIPMLLQMMENGGELSINSEWGGESRAMIQALLELDLNAQVKVKEIDKDKNSSKDNNFIDSICRLFNENTDNPNRTKRSKVESHFKVCGIEIKKEHFFNDQENENGEHTFSIGCGCLLFIIFGLLLLKMLF